MAQLSDLPVEMKNKILTYLPINDVLNLRLTSREWKEIGYQGWLNEVDGPFIEHGVLPIRRHRNDVTQMIQVGRNQQLRTVARHLKIYTGATEMSILWYIQETYQKEKQDEFDLVFKEAVDRSSRYERNQHDSLLVVQGFAELPNIDALSLLSLESPFSESEPVLHRSFNTARSKATDESDIPFVNEQVSLLTHLVALVAAFSRLKDKLQQLKLDSMPLDFFVRPGEDIDASDSDPDSDSDDEPILLRKLARRHVGRVVKRINFPDKMTTLSRNVRELQIGIRHFSTNVMLRHETSRTLSQYLGSMQFLRSLDFSWDIGKHRYWNGLDTGFELALQESFYANAWPHLKNLRLCRVPTNTALLSSFIQKHASHLKRLSLVYLPSEMSEDEMSCKELLTRFRDNLSLEKFQFLVRDIHNNQPAVFEIWDRDWRETSANWEFVPDWRERFGIPYTNEKLFEAYILRKCAWPMENERILDDHIWKCLSEWELE